MGFAADLHIHSALSACADNEMTPNNIVNMAIIKGLELIAVTDHNSCGNVESVIQCAKRINRENGTNLRVIPGMEVETSEEIHMLCLFKSIDAAMRFDQMVKSTLPFVKLREDIFGEQLYMDEYDEVVKRESSLLSIACGLSVEEVFESASSLGGIVIPAHIDRESGSMLNVFGVIPEHLAFDYVELSKKGYSEKLEEYRYLQSKYKIITSSDAHFLGDILERGLFNMSEMIHL